MLVIFRGQIAKLVKQKNNLLIFRLKRALVLESSFAMMKNLALFNTCFSKHKKKTSESINILNYLSSLFSSG